MTLAQCAQQRRAVGADAGHGQVGEDGMAGFTLQQVEQLGTVGRAAGHLHLVSLQHDTDAMQYNRMVVGDDDARLHAGSSGKRSGAPEVASTDSAKPTRARV